MLFLYNIFGIVLFILSPLILFFRLINGKEDPKRFKEKIFVNHFNANKSNNLKLLWFHAASIGEFKSIVRLIKEIKFYPIVKT